MSYKVNKKGADYMSEKEKEVLEKLKEVIPKMSEFDKGYILGKVENMAAEAKKN
jgi:hypothetical protein